MKARWAYYKADDQHIGFIYLYVCLLCLIYVMYTFTNPPPFFFLSSWSILCDMRVLIHRRRCGNHVRWGNCWMLGLSIILSCISFQQTHVYMLCVCSLSSLLLVGFPARLLCSIFFVLILLPFLLITLHFLSFFRRIGITRLPISSLQATPS